MLRFFTITHPLRSIKKAAALSLTLIMLSISACSTSSSQPQANATPQDIRATLSQIKPGEAIVVKNDSGVGQQMIYKGLTDTTIEGYAKSIPLEGVTEVVLADDVTTNTKVDGSMILASAVVILGLLAIIAF